MYDPVQLTLSKTTDSMVVKGIMRALQLELYSQSLEYCVLLNILTYLAGGMSHVMSNIRFQNNHTQAYK